MNQEMQGGLSGLAARAVAFAMVLSLTACGGGGGGGTTPPPVVVEPSIPDATTQAAGKAELRAYSTPSINKAELKWTDWIEGETGFRIDKSVNGAWTQVTTLAANANQPWGMGWTGTLDAAATSYRVVALLTGGKEVALKSPTGLTELKLGPAPAGAAIALNMAEPLKGEVKLSITGAPEAQSAGFYIDLNGGPLPISATKPSFETTWDTDPYTNGSHKISSLLQYAPDTFVELQRAVVLANADLKASIVASISTAPEARVYVIPTSRSGAATLSASLSIDGKSVGTRTTTDCYWPPRGNSCVAAYLFTLNSADYGFGAHALQATVSGAAGDQVQVSGSMTKAIPLVVSVTSPTNALFAGQKVQIRGEISGDPAKQVGYSVDFGDRRVLQGNGYGPISADVDMTGLPDGIYYLVVSAGDPAVPNSNVQTARYVFWQANPPMSYEKVGDVDAGLLASGRAGVLRTNGDFPEWLPLSGSPVTLTGGNGAYGEFKYAPTAAQWVGRLWGFDQGLYAWGADGTRRTLVASGATAFSAAGSRAGWLETLAGVPTLTLTELAAPAPVSTPLSGDPARTRPVAVSLGNSAGGTAVAAYSVDLLDAQGNRNGSAAFVFDAASNKHRQLSSPATVAFTPLTDGRRVAWRSGPDASAFNAADLWVAPVDGSTAPQLLGAMTTSAQWTDGLLVWAETANAGSLTLKAYRDGTVTTLLTQLQAQVLAVGSGAVAYKGGKRLLVWTPDKGERLVHGVFEGQGWGSVAIADGWLYFTTGSVLYRVPL